MLDRQKVEAILSRRFPGAASDQVAAAANAIMGLSEEWEVTTSPSRSGSSAGANTARIVSAVGRISLTDDAAEQ